MIRTGTPGPIMQKSMYQIDEKRLAALKAKHGDVYEITVEDKAAVFRKPSRQDLSFATNTSSQGKDPIAFTEAIMKNTYIEGDRELVDDDNYFLGAMQVVSVMVEAKQAEIKKL